MIENRPTFTPIMKIHIMGASCAGSTTLGNALAKHLGLNYFDTDDYFWAPSDIPYTIKRDRDERITSLRSDVNAAGSCIVGGSLVSWGDEWLTMFDMVVFLYIPHDIRMQRLHDREVERYGDLIFTDPVRVEGYKKFMDWARGYDNNTTVGRTLQVHQDWIAKLGCPVLVIEGDTTVEERIKLVLGKMATL